MTGFVPSCRIPPAWEGNPRLFFLSVSSISRSVCPHVEGKLILLIINNIMCVLKRLVFSQVIHIFFSSQKNVNLKREIYVPLERGAILFATFVFSLARQ